MNNRHTTGPDGKEVHLSRENDIDSNAQVLVARVMMNKAEQLKKQGKAPKFVISVGDNFYPGVSKSSVIRQLNTAELSTYDTTFIANGSRIVAYSPLHLGMMSCRIDFNKQDIVVFSIAQ